MVTGKPVLRRVLVSAIALLVLASLGASPASQEPAPESRPQTADPREASPVERASPPQAARQTRKGPTLTTLPSDTRKPKPARRGKVRGTPLTKDALQKLEKEWLGRWAKIESVSARLLTKFERAKGQRTLQQGEGTRDCMKKDGRVLMRSSIINTISVKREHDTEIPWILTGQHISKVSDGRFVYTVDRRREGTTVTKNWAVPPHIIPIGGKWLTTVIRGLQGLRRLRDTTIGDEQVYVLEGTSKNGRIVHRFSIDKKTGLLRELAVNNRIDSSKFSVALSDIRLNVEFSEDHFDFVAPEGIEIQDLTVPGTPRPQPTPQAQASPPVRQP